MLKSDAKKGDSHLKENFEKSELMPLKTKKWQKKVMSHLDNAPIYLVGCVIQKRRYFFSDQTPARFVFGALQLVTSLLNAKRRVSAEPIEAYGNGSIGPILLMCVWMDLQDRQFSIVMCASGFTCRGFQLLLGWIVGTSWIKACWIERKTEKSTVKKFIRLFWC